MSTRVTASHQTPAENSAHEAYFLACDYYSKTIALNLLLLLSYGMHTVVEGFHAAHRDQCWRRSTDTQPA